MNNNDLQLITPIISVVLVALFGLISNFIIIRMNQRQSISNKMIEHYINIREEITSKISNLASYKPANTDLVLNSSLDISKLYYKYYDFLPQEVLNELLCLYSTLIDKNNRIYRIKNSALYLIEETDLEEYIISTTPIPNSKFYTYYLLNSKDVTTMKITCVALQARKVLNTMNIFFTPDNLILWVKQMSKKRL